MTEAIRQAVVEAAEATVRVMRETEGPAKSRKTVWVAPTASGPTLRQ